MSPSTFLIHLLRTYTLFQQETKVSLPGEPPCCDPSVLKLYIVPVAPNERSQKSMLCPMGQDLKFLTLDWYFLMTYYKDDYQSLSVNCLNIMIFFPKRDYDTTLVMFSLVQRSILNSVAHDLS